MSSSWGSARLLGDSQLKKTAFCSLCHHVIYTRLTGTPTEVLDSSALGHGFWHAANQTFSNKMVSSKKFGPLRLKHCVFNAFLATPRQGSQRLYYYYIHLIQICWVSGPGASCSQSAWSQESWLLPEAPCLNWHICQFCCCCFWAKKITRMSIIPCICRVQGASSSQEILKNCWFPSKSDQNQINRERPNFSMNQ